MIKNPHLLHELEDKIICQEKSSFEKNLKLFEAMWKEGVSLGVLPPQNPLDGIEVDINIARILNS